MFNQAAYFGVSSPIYGTLTMGRQSALSSDLIVNYDPLAGSNAWSVITFQGANGGGGVTQNRVFDNSFEYRVAVGPVRFAVETQLRSGGSTNLPGNAIQGNIGFDYMGFSMDFLGSKITDAVSASPLGFSPRAHVNEHALPLGNGQHRSDDLRQHFVPGRRPLYAWPVEAVRWLRVDSVRQPGQPDLDLVPTSRGTTLSLLPNNNGFVTDKILQTAWVGVRYSITPALDITGAYYHEWQNSFNNGNGSNP